MHAGKQSNGRMETYKYSQKHTVGEEFSWLDFPKARTILIDEKSKKPFSIVIGNELFMHECFSKHSSMGTARMK